MPLDFTPGQFARRAEFYHQLGALTGAGLGLIRGLETLQRNPPARSYRQPIKRVLEQLAHGYTFAESLRRVAQWLPGFDIALSRLAAALEALLGAGVTVIEAWELAATASGSPALRRTVQAWRPLVNAGQTPAEAVSASTRFPEMFANQYNTGEVSGTLDDTLRRLHNYYQQEGSRKLHAVAQWTPRAVYFLIMMMIAVYVVRFWMG